MRKTIEGVVATQRASKHHVCSREGCVQPILNGSEYRRVMGDDDKVRRFHIPCYAAEFPKEEKTSSCIRCLESGVGVCDDHL